MADPPRFHDRVRIVLTGTVVKDNPRFPTAAVLVKLDDSGECNWFAPSDCEVIERSPQPGAAEGEKT